MRRLGVFVDIPSQYEAVKQLLPGRRVNYERFLHSVSDNCELIRAIAYVTQMESEALAFTSTLRRIGYSVRLNQAIKVRDRPNIIGTDRIMTLAIDAIRLLPKIDEIVFGSSDSRLVPLIQYCQSQGIYVRVVSLNIPSDLIVASDISRELDGDILESVVEQVVGELVN